MDDLRKLLEEVEDLNAELRSAGISEIDVTRETLLLESNGSVQGDPDDKIEIANVDPRILNGKNLPKEIPLRYTLLLSMARSAATLQLFYTALSDIEGGLREEPPDLKRIRRAGRRIDRWLGSLAEDFSTFAGWIACPSEGHRDSDDRDDVYHKTMEQIKRGRKQR